MTPVRVTMVDWVRAQVSSAEYYLRRAQEDQAKAEAHAQAAEKRLAEWRDLLAEVSR